VAFSGEVRSAGFTLQSLPNCYCAGAALLLRRSRAAAAETLNNIFLKSGASRISNSLRARIRVVCGVLPDVSIVEKTGFSPQASDLRFCKSLVQYN